MKLKKILVGVDFFKILNFKDFNIKSISHISGDVESSSIFVCIKGNHFDGNCFVDDAILRGAKCIITEDENCFVDSNCCFVYVKDVRKTMSIIAKNFYNRSVDRLKVIGVVGTSGKTTTTLIAEQLLQNCGYKVGVIGTNGIFINGISLNNNFTTPDPLDLHYIFYQMENMGIEVVVMEVSAQAIYYKKVFGINFDIGVFTNISKEHLDFFGSMENYVKCKMNFFNKKNMKQCVVNIDDFYGRELAYKVDIPCVSYGLNDPCNTFAINIKYGFDRTEFVANVLDDVYKVDSPFVGDYNLKNMLAALTVVKLIGVDDNQIKNAIKKLKVIDGRYNVYRTKGKVVIIDFAHTPDSIENSLKHIKFTSDYKIVSVFGCVGYSDEEKRKDMAMAVDKYSSRIIVTSDNPGNVKFEEIANDIVKGFGKHTNCVFIEDRTEAIKYGFDNLRNDEILVLIGKGAENFQKIGDKKVEYSDKSCVEELLKV